ncbi:MAG: SDR family oxidoreductase [Acidobacteria bacterium]|nr:SDR family oxidoreductase [Acidobacteriota bacterium]
MTGKVAWITGGSQGIGQGCAVELARAGCDIAFCDIGAEAETIRLVEALGRRALFVEGDVSNRESMEAVAQRIMNTYGRLDILVNNAAFGVRKAFLDLEIADVERVWAVALWGVFHCSQIAARLMAKAANGGSIISISSVHAERAFPMSTAYNAAKSGVNAMTLTWASELAQYKIRVNAIEPGWTDTPGERRYFSEELIREEGKKLPLGRLAEPAEIGKAARFLASEDAAYITGTILKVDGGFLLPMTTVRV